MPEVKSRGDIVDATTSLKFRVANRLTDINITVERNTWDKQAVFALKGYISIDGSPFKLFAIIDDIGGNLFFDNGVARIYSDYRTKLKPGINRRIYFKYSTSKRINSRINAELT